MPDELTEEPIHPMTQNEIDGVCSIWLIGSLTAHGFIPLGYWHSRLKDVKRHFEQAMQDKQRYEAYVHKETYEPIKGFVIMQCKNANKEHVNYMEELFVDLPYQGKGIGTQLLEHIRKNKSFLETDVYQLNTDAIAFYVSKGFRTKTEQQGAVRVEQETGQWKLRVRWDNPEEGHPAIS